MRYLAMDPSAAYITGQVCEIVTRVRHDAVSMLTTAVAQPWHHASSWCCVRMVFQRSGGPVFLPPPFISQAHAVSMIPMHGTRMPRRP